MDRISRLACIVVVLLIISFSILPLAEARGLSGSTAVTGATDWFSAAVSWLTELLIPGHTKHRPNGLSNQSANSSTSGGCIDPMGCPR